MKAAAVRVARPGALQLVAGLGDATSTRPQVLRDATRLTRAVWQSAAALLRSVIVQLAAVLSFLFMSPALAGAAPALDARGPAAIEAPAPDVAASRQARVVLVAQAAVPQATPQEHLAQAWKHTAAAASAAVGEVTSPIQTKFEETLRPLKDTMKPVWDGSFKPTWEGSVKPAWEGTIKPGAEKLAARASTLLHETVDSAKSLVDRVGDKGAAAQGHHDHAHHAGHDADTVYRTKGLSAIRAHGDAELAAHGASAPAATDAEVQARFPDWKKITRSELLHMDLHHHAHDDHDQVAGKGFFATLVTPLTMLFGFVKIMWPLTMLSVPIIWVFPWELITGGFKSSRKFFNDVPGSKEEEATANRTRENVLWASTFLNMVVSVVFGSGGGGGGGHH